VTDNKLQKRVSATLAEKGQYALAFVVVAAMLLVAGFPTFVIFFFGIFAYFLWKIFSSGSRSETREIFEFYLSANEILRDDERRWFGFEIREAIERGEAIVNSMGQAPPLLHFTLGALYGRAGEHKDAVAHLGKVIEGDDSDEIRMVAPSHELRNYVRVLRKIERDPAEAPLTSAAVRSLERARRLRGPALLTEYRRRVAAEARDEKATDRQIAAALSDGQRTFGGKTAEEKQRADETPPKPASVVSLKKRDVEKRAPETYANRKPISEVLHDIYDDNIQ
jgi:hypothetical protein